MSLQTDTEECPLKNKTKPAEYLLHLANEHKPTRNQVEVADTLSHHKLHPWHSNPQSGENSNLGALP